MPECEAGRDCTCSICICGGELTEFSFDITYGFILLFIFTICKIDLKKYGQNSSKPG